MDLKDLIYDLGRRARAASKQLAQLSSEQKNAGLRAMAQELIDAQDAILAANAQDVQRATASGLSSAMLDRLTLTPARIEKMAEGSGRSPRCPIPWGQSSANGPGPTAS